MTVKLISISQPLLEVDGKKLSPEELISYCARVSSPQNQDNLDTAPKLLKYCIKNGHWSVFEMANMVVEVTTSRAISAQILRHKSMNFQEFSQRYAETESAVMYDARRQDLKNRQNSIDDLPQETKDWFLNAQADIVKMNFGLYKEALEKGVSKESARFLLPMSSETKMYMNGTVRSFIHYLQARCDESTQLEHRQIANNIKNLIFKPNFPNISEALGW